DQSPPAQLAPQQINRLRVPRARVLNTHSRTSSSTIHTRGYTQLPSGTRTPSTLTPWEAPRAMHRLVAVDRGLTRAREQRETQLDRDLAVRPVSLLEGASQFAQPVGKLLGLRHRHAGRAALHGHHIRRSGNTALIERASQLRRHVIDCTDGELYGSALSLRSAVCVQEPGRQLVEARNSPVALLRLTLMHRDRPDEPGHLQFAEVVVELGRTDAERLTHLGDRARCRDDLLDDRGPERVREDAELIELLHNHDLGWFVVVRGRCP